VEPKAIAERIWPGKAADVEELGGGITNRNFKVRVEGDVFVVRVAGKDTGLLGIDRGVEHGASLAAAKLGIGPEVALFVAPEGWLVTHFIEGRAVPAEEMRQPRRIGEAARTLRALHESPPIPGRFDSFRVVEDYRATAEAHGVAVPEDYARAKERATEIERVRGAGALAPCHNDLLNANFIDDGERLRIVDWEYAGMGDRFFDLANFSVNHEFDEQADEALLEAYFGDVSPDQAASLRLMRFMSDFREAMWGVVQQGISELDFDFVAYARDHFDRLRRTAADPAFEGALRTASESPAAPKA
jgi:thiamine kinase-like enzyme